MLQFRLKIIECVMCSESRDSVKKMMLEVMQGEIQKGISAKRIMQAIPVLEFDMLFQMRLEHTEKESDNIKEALRVFRQGIHLGNVQ